MSSRKIGRPTVEDPKNYRFSIRLDKAAIELLDKYCQKKNIKRAEAIREGIYKLEDDL